MNYTLLPGEDARRPRVSQFAKQTSCDGTRNDVAQDTPATSFRGAMTDLQIGCEVSFQGVWGRRALFGSWARNNTGEAHLSNEKQSYYVG
jgi:hypothetical protein